MAPASRDHWNRFVMNMLASSTPTTGSRHLEGLDAPFPRDVYLCWVDGIDI
jgi:hypothetical protein